MSYYGLIFIKFYVLYKPILKENPSFFMNQYPENVVIFGRFYEPMLTKFIIFDYILSTGPQGVHQFSLNFVMRNK